MQRFHRRRLSLPRLLGVLAATLLLVSTAAACGGGGIPSYRISVGTQAIYGPPNMVRVFGSWDFPNSWAGQAYPVDVATLEMTQLPSCVHLVNFQSETYDYAGHPTGLSDLSDANLRYNSPIWEIRDYTRGFVPQADNGWVSVVLQNWCFYPVHFGAAFAYDANQGGSVTGVTAGWGLLSVSYGSRGLERKESSAPTYYNF